MNTLSDVAGLLFQTRAQVQLLQRQVAGFLNPVGAIQLWTGQQDNIPSGWLNCDGSSVLISAYPELYSVIGIIYGQVDGTHFNLPNFTGKFAIGVSTANVIGSSGGSKTITTDNMPNHNHPNTASFTGLGISVSTNSTATLPDHSHSIQDNTSALSNRPIAYTGIPVEFGNMGVGHTTVANNTGSVNGSIGIGISSSSVTTISDPSHTHDSGLVGGGEDYLQPYTSVFYTICYSSKFPIA